MEKTTYTNAYVDNKLKELSYLLFNDENWAKFLHSITQLAQKYSVRIKVIENKINEPSIQKIEQILTLKVDFSGSFANTMKFMNAIENMDSVERDIIRNGPFTKAVENCIPVLTALIPEYQDILTRVTNYQKNIKMKVKKGYN